jgi:ATPase family associated with various cellular activities (AAA)
LPVIELCGGEFEANRSIAATAAALLDLRLYVLDTRNLPQSCTAETNLLMRLWEREAVLSKNALLLESGSRDAADASSENVLSCLLELIHSPLIVSTHLPRRSIGRARIVFPVGKPTRIEQAAIWRSTFEAQSLNGTVEALVSQFNLAPVAIHSAARRADAAARQNAESSSMFKEELWNACRIEGRPRLEGLAQRIEPIATWDDLVLLEKDREMLRRIAMHVRQRTTVYESWGFTAKSSRGLGISALFAGASGTGKTMAAEVLAHTLRLDLFRVDLSQVISKYIGETEKNLSRIFDAADEGAAILLFDEADALFGKRSEVKDSHDRYANVEVSYLLQRMEAYRGLAVLTTNRKNALDHAFLRRIRFVVDFPFPETAQRAEIWSRAFPQRTPTEDLQIDRLARLRVSGGNIHNIAMGAAFLAADAQQPVRMEHLLAAARNEFAKLETPLTDAEVAGWV